MLALSARTTWTGRWATPIASLHADDHLVASRGMEAVRWTPGAAEWSGHVGRLVAHLDGRATANVIAVMVPTFLLGLAAVILAFNAGSDFIYSLLGEETPSQSVFMTVGGGAFLFFPFLGIVARWWARSQRDDLFAASGAPPEIVVTSTGVTVGDVARAWNGRRFRLSRMAITYEGEHPYVTFAFERRRRWRRTGAGAHLRVPIPPTLVADLMELASMLNQRRPDGAQPLPLDVPL